MYWSVTICRFPMILRTFWQLSNCWLQIFTVFCDYVAISFSGFFECSFLSFEIDVNNAGVFAVAFGSFEVSRMSQHD